MMTQFSITKNSVVWNCGGLLLCTCLQIDFAFCKTRGIAMSFFSSSLLSEDHYKQNITLPAAVRISDVISDKLNLRVSI
jgi:hypothetical protein